AIQLREGGIAPISQTWHTTKAQARGGAPASAHTQMPARPVGPHPQVVHCQLAILLTKQSSNAVNWSCTGVCLILSPPHGVVVQSRLLLDSRVVDVPGSSNPIVVTLSSLKPFFSMALNKEVRFSDQVGA